MCSRLQRRVVAYQVGDSSALLGGTMGEGEDEEVTFEELMAEHSATNAEEYTRVMSHPRGPELQFVYDTPELIDEGKAPQVRAAACAGRGWCEGACECLHARAWENASSSHVASRGVPRPRLTSRGLGCPPLDSPPLSIISFPFAYLRSSRV